MQDMRKKCRYKDNNAIATTARERPNLNTTNISDSDEKLLSSIEALSLEKFEAEKHLLPQSDPVQYSSIKSREA